MALAKTIVIINGYDKYMKNKCSKCQIVLDKSVLIVYCKKINGNEYYHCRRCNTERMRKYVSTKNGKAKLYAAIYKSIEKHPERQDARIKLNVELKAGRIIKPLCCSKCLLDKKLEAHHEDYTKPLDVIWFCRPCHSNHHKTLETVNKQ